MSLNLTPITPGSLTLTPISASISKSYLLLESGSRITLADSSGFILIGGSGSGPSLEPISPGSLPLTPISSS